MFTPPVLLQGFEYDASGGGCCGECVQKSCVVTLEDQSTHTVEVSTGLTAQDEDDDEGVTSDCGAGQPHLRTPPRQVCPVHVPEDRRSARHQGDQDQLPPL